MAWKHKLRRLPQTVGRMFWTVPVEPKRLGAMNVYDAAIASAGVYRRLRTEVWSLRLSLALRLPTRAASRVFRGLSAGRRAEMKHQ